METGRVGFKIRDVEDLLTLYGVTDEQQRSRFLDLARQSSAPDWWAKYSDILPDWFETYLGLESAAPTIRSFEVQFVPGLFQTEDYARAVTRLGHKPRPTTRSSAGSACASSARNCSPGRTRQDLGGHGRGGAAPAGRRARGDARPAPAPRRGGRAAAGDPAGRPVRPGGHAGASGSFSMLRFEERDLPDVVYIEQLTSAVYLDQRPDVEHYLEVVDQLSGEALTPADTTRFIEQVARET